MYVCNLTDICNNHCVGFRLLSTTGISAPLILTEKYELNEHALEIKNREKLGDGVGYMLPDFLCNQVLIVSVCYVYFAFSISIMSNVQIECIIFFYTIEIQKCLLSFI